MLTKIQPYMVEKFELKSKTQMLATFDLTAI